MKKKLVSQSAPGNQPFAWLRSVFHLLTVATLFGLSVHVSHAQTLVDPRTKTTATIVNHGWSAKGDLILGIKIQAGGKKVSLGNYGGPGSLPSSQPTQAFSMAASWLVDRFSDQKIPARSMIPDEPFFGTMSGIIILNPGDTMTFGAAFPRPPDPPRAENGNPQNYKLILHIPDMEAVEFSIPQPKPVIP